MAFCSYGFSMINSTFIFRQVIQGYKKTLVFDDLYDMMDIDKSAPIIDIVEKEWEKQTKGIDYKR
jgi:hypothetical protein